MVHNSPSSKLSILASEDGLNWHKHPTGSLASYRQLAIDGDHLIATGVGGTIVSFRNIGPSISQWPNGETVLSLTPLIHSCW